MEKRNYAKPYMVVEAFRPQHYCATCVYHAGKQFTIIGECNLNRSQPMMHGGSRYYGGNGNCDLYWTETGVPYEGNGGSYVEGSLTVGGQSFASTAAIYAYFQEHLTEPGQTIESVTWSTKGTDGITYEHTGRLELTDGSLNVS